MHNPYLCAKNASFPHKILICVHKVINFWKLYFVFYVMSKVPYKKKTFVTKHDLKVIIQMSIRLCRLESWSQMIVWWLAATSPPSLPAASRESCHWGEWALSPDSSSLHPLKWMWRRARFALTYRKKFNKSFKTGKRRRLTTRLQRMCTVALRTDSSTNQKCWNEDKSEGWSDGAVTRGFPHRGRQRSALCFS